MERSHSYEAGMPRIEENRREDSVGIQDLSSEKLGGPLVPEI